MTLKVKSIIISLLALAVIVFSLKLFTDYNALNDSIVTNLLVTEGILSAEESIYKSLADRRPDIDNARTIAARIPEIVKRVKTEDLTPDELNNFITAKLSFIRIGRVLKSADVGKALAEPELRQIRNELVKIENSTSAFKESFSQRTERERIFKKNVVAVIYLSLVFGIILVSIYIYRYFIRPILSMSSQVKAVRDGMAENISIYRAGDEIGRLSEFTHQTLDDLRKSSEALSLRYGMQYAVSEILKASQQAEDIDVFFRKTLDMILSLKWLSIMNRGGIFLLDEKNPGRLVLKAEHSFPEPQKKACAELSVGKCICGKVALSGKSMHSASCLGEHEISYEGMAPHGHYCVPIKYEDGVLGVISLYLEDGHALSKTEAEFIEAISMIIAETLMMRKLAEKEHLVTLAVEETGEGVMIAGRNGEIEYVNPAVERITGYSRDELIGSSLASQIATAEPGGGIMRDVLGGNPWSGAVKNKRKDGEEYQEYMAVGPIKDEKGDVLKIVAIRRDITKERRLEEQLAQSQKMELVGRLAGGVAHDFNNYMTAVIGYGGIALKLLKSDDPAKRHIETVMNAAKMATNLTKQLLAFSRKQIIQPEVVNLNAVVSEMGKMLGRLIGENVELEIAPAGGLWNVKVDVGQIEQALMNLVINARDAMPEGGKLTIETANAMFDEEYAKGHIDTAPGEHVMISVSDTGHGMTDDVKSHIFEPFFTTKEKGKGTGLGLAMVHGIITQNNGHIYVYSEPGRGTSFKIYLPRIRAEAAPKKKEVEALDKLHGSETILVVEDQDVVRQLAADILSGLGYTVMEAKEGLDALELCRKYHGRIHLLLTDVIMPKMGGPELVEKIKEMHPAIKVLYMSGYTDNTIAHHGILDEGVHLIHKPFTESGLAEEVRRALDG